MDGKKIRKQEKRENMGTFFTEEIKEIVREGNEMPFASAMLVFLSLQAGDLQGTLGESYHPSCLPDKLLTGWPTHLQCSSHYLSLTCPHSSCACDSS